MRWNWDAFSATAGVGVGVETAAIDVMRGFLEISEELLRRLRFSGASLCFFNFLSRCLEDGVESIVVGLAVGASARFFFFLSPFLPFSPRAEVSRCGGRVTVVVK